MVKLIISTEEIEQLIKTHFGTTKLTWVEGHQPVVEIELPLKTLKTERLVLEAPQGLIDEGFTTPEVFSADGYTLKEAMWTSTSSNTPQ